MENPFGKHYTRCNSGDPRDKYNSLDTFPHLIDVELTSACNFRCLMCPTGNLSLARPAKFMAVPTLQKIVDQCAGKADIRFIGWGEPMSHPDVFEVVASCNEKGIMTHMNTNGSYLEDTVATWGLLKMRLTSLKFSFQGVDRKSYAEMRNTDFYDELLARIRRLREMQDQFYELHSHRTFISLSTTTTYETQEQIDAFLAEVSPYLDEVSVGKTTFDFLNLDSVRLKPEDKQRLAELMAEDTSSKVHPDPCPEVYDKLSIHADGSVHVCCNDYDGVTDLGNVNDTPIEKIWRHPTMEWYRERLANKNYDQPLCRDCYDYLGVTEGR
jgi:radical SAM protein with 4Fe4S-binding SPASM domain